ncbi:MAG TPA: GNAT family N-acetyltransferase [Anaerolineales bacterium]|jgi:GNAT superfamily N-acetyltransferase|nr:GNAT family N-acetyltransferase [Anaerolineales bacterium]
MDIQIRRAAPEEAGALSQIALVAKRHWGYPERWMELWKPELTFDRAYFEQNESWVAANGGQQVGFYTLQEKDGHAWLDNLFIKPEYMGQGIGKTLFNHAIEVSRQHGHILLRWESDPNATGFYEKLGARKIGERRSEVDGQSRRLPIMEINL